MPFSGRLFEPDGFPTDETSIVPTNDLLPDDLAALGEQLTDESHHLVACYTARAKIPTGSGKLMSARGSQTSWRDRAVAATAGLSAVAMFLLAATNFWVPPAADHPVHRVPVRTAVTERGSIDAPRSDVVLNPGMPRPAGNLAVETH